MPLGHVPEQEVVVPAGQEGRPGAEAPEGFEVAQERPLERPAVRRPVPQEAGLVHRPDRPVGRERDRRDVRVGVEPGLAEGADHERRRADVRASGRPAWPVRGGSCRVLLRGPVRPVVTTATAGGNLLKSRTPSRRKVSTGITPVDYSRGYMLLSDAQTLLNKKNIINEIVIRTEDYTQAEQYAVQIEAVSGYRTESWQESNANFLKIFKIQDLITYIITGALLLVAAFGVLNILIMAVLERVNDIAILKSIGYSRADITLIYLFQGMVIGVIGASLGLVCGKLTIEGLRKIPITVEGLVRAEGLLMSEHVSSYYTAFFAAVAVVMIAAVYPARRAATYDPVEVIRGGTLKLPCIKP